VKRIKRSVKNNQLQDVYDKYKERKVEKEKIKSRTRTKVITISLSLLIIISFVIIILIWYKSKRKDRIHQESLNEKDRYIANKEEIISKTNEEVKQKESEIKNLVEIIDGHKSDINSLKNELSIKEHEISCKETDIRKMENDLSAKEIELEKLQKNVHENSILIDRLSENHKTNEELMIAYIEEIEKLKTEIDETRNNLRDIRFRSSLIEGKINSKNTELQKKEEEINRYKLELSEYKNKLEIISSDNNDNAYTPKIGMDLYLQSKVCSKILNEINELSERNRDANILTPLKQEELVMLLNSASFYVNNFTNGIACKYSKLKKEDLYYLSLALIGLKDKQISSLLGVTYNSIRIRKKNLCSILGIKNDELQSFLMNICN
jgi:chromosome segregation ATPase